MAKSYRRRPIITLRLDNSKIIALRMAANKHGVTVSDLLRELIDEQLSKDGIPTTSEPLPGQMSM